MRKLVLCSIVLVTLGACVKKPLLVFPPSKDAQIQALEKENAKLRETLTTLERKCRLVLTLYKQKEKLTQGGLGK